MPGARHYSDTEKRQAVAHALVLGPKEAARQLGIPHRTVSEWWRNPRWLGDVDPDTRAQLTSTVFEVMSECLIRLQSRIKNPHTSALELARAFETLRDTHALLLGKATQNIAVASYADTMPPGERRQLMAYLDSLLRRLDEGDIDGVEHEVGLQLQAEREIDRLLASGEAATPEDAGRMITAPAEAIEGECRDAD